MKIRSEATHTIELPESEANALGNALHAIREHHRADRELWHSLDQNGLVSELITKLENRPRV